MKISVNRNIVWCNAFTGRLSELGVKYVCISPGSRSTSLTLSFASNNNFKVFPIVDERSSAFFALGIAKATKTPVAIVTTSGTAVAELYPAIIEAYYQRIPLIICTADRPRSLRGSGANQTINQHNIFNNHIRMFVDAGLPDLRKLTGIRKTAENAIRISQFVDRGPVHLNFPFDKPFEPESTTDSIEEKELENIYSEDLFELDIFEGKPQSINFSPIMKKFNKIRKGLILVGYNNYKNDFGDLLVQLSQKFNYPVYVDGASSLRYGNHEKENIIENFTAIVRAENFTKEYDPELIIQFGGTPTSNAMLEFFKNSRAEKILVNEFGDRNDPSLTAKKIFKINPGDFCKIALDFSEKSFPVDSGWLDDYKTMNLIAGTLKEEFLYNSKFPFEGRIGIEAILNMPEKSNLMISNSLPIRDIDFFAPALNKQVNLFTNRGASGIDGINSTALGIAVSSDEPTFLLIGDLAFYHDMNGLHNAVKYKIPITVILINNAGGGIFESLPIAEYTDFMKNNFLTPLNLDFRKLVEAYNGKFIKIKSWHQLKKELKLSVKGKNVTVLEIKTDAKESKLLRQNYWSSVSKIINQYIDEAKNRRNPVSHLGR